MAAATPQNQPLPSKETNLFKQLVKFYEDKQHKKAIKAADTILKRVPDHGETLAMKGLTLSNMGADKKEEAYELVRRGLKADLKSHVCWHVYGLLYRADRNYREAIKCYQNALRLDSENVQILRDLATLQIQMRDLPGFVETRQRLLALKPSNRNNWITFALAQHANKAFEVAVQVLEAYENSLSEIPASEAYEHSELLLYKALVLDEGGKLKEALQLLDTQQSKLKDRLGMLEHRASLLLRLGQLTEAEAQYRELLALNPDHYRYHEGLQACLGLRPATPTPTPTPTPTTPAAGPVIPGAGLTPEQRSKLDVLYRELAGTYPRSSACTRIPLDFLQGAAFEAALDSYVRRYLQKGIPSLFQDLKPLYSDADKVASIGKLMESYNTSLTRDSRFPALLAAAAADNGANGHVNDQESPQTRVWVLYYLAQHYDRLGQYTKGLELLSEAAQHTPTLIELNLVQSKLLRHAGDLEGAAHAAETARRMDLSDRYLNSMAIKALFRANKVDAAEKTVALFTKDSDQVIAMSALHDMQHMWVECAAGAAHLRRHELGKALKRFTAVVRHFEDIHEDQFDFHGYCVRKTTLRAYVSTLRWEDGLFNNPYYLKAGAGAVRTYLALADKPTAAQQEADEEALLAGMSPEERKKYKQARRKEEKAKAREASEAAARAEAAAKEAAAAAKKKGAAGAAVDKRERDPDPDGAKLLAGVEDPLAEATKLVVSMKQHVPSYLDTHLLAAEVYCRRGKLLLALAAVQAAVRIGGASHPGVHKALVKFCQKAAAPAAPDAAPVHPTVSSLLSEGIRGLLGGADVKQYASTWQSTHGSSSLAHRMAAGEVALQLGLPDANAQVVKLFEGATPGSADQHSDCVAVAELLSCVSADAGVKDKWCATCAAAFPYSRTFTGARCINLNPDYDFDTMMEAFGKLAF